MMILMTMQWDGDDDDEDYAAVTIVYLRGHRCIKRVTDQKNMKMITMVEDDELRCSQCSKRLLRCLKTGEV